MYKRFKEVACERNLKQNFSSGVINFKWTLEDRITWNPSESFFKLRMKFTKGDDSRLDKAFGLAPNYFVCDNLFLQMCMKINGVNVGKYGDYVAQCSALRHRMLEDQNVKESLMSSVNYAQPYVDDRINQVSSDGLENSVRYNDQVNSLTRAQTFANSNIDEANDTLALGANNGVFTYNDNAGADLDIRNDLSVGDYVRITTQPAVNDSQSETVHRITAITQLTMTVSPIPSAVGLAANVNNHGIFNIRKVLKEKIDTVQSNTVELIWKPALDFWNINDELPDAQYHMELYPFASSVLQKYVVEALSNLNVGNLATDFKVEVEDMLLYLSETRHHSPMSGQKTYHLNEVMCSSQTLTTNNLTSKTFSLHPRNHSITVAYQSQDVGNNITKSRTKFKADNNEELNIIRQLVQKGQIKMPYYEPDIQVSDGVQYIAQRYYENLAYSKGLNLLKVESLKQYLDTGAYYHYKFGNYDCNSVNIYSQFSQAFTSNPQVLCFDHFDFTVSINISNGEITEVKTH